MNTKAKPFTLVGARFNGDAVYYHAWAESPAQLEAVAEQVIDNAYWFLLHGHAEQAGVLKPADFRECLSKPARSKPQVVAEYRRWCENNANVWPAGLTELARERMRSIVCLEGRQESLTFTNGRDGVVVGLRTAEGAEFTLGVLSIDERGTWCAARYSPKAWLENVPPLSGGYRVVSQHLNSTGAFRSLWNLECAGIVSTELTRPDVDDNLMEAFKRRAARRGLQGLALLVQEGGVIAVSAAHAGVRVALGFLRCDANDGSCEALAQSDWGLSGTRGHCGYQVISRHAAIGAAFQALLDTYRP